MKKILVLLICFLAFDVSGQSADSIAVSEITNKVDSINRNLAGDTTESVMDVVKKDMKPPSIGELISVGKIFWSVVFILVGYFGIRFLSSILESFAERSTNYRITIKGLIPIIKIFGWFFVVFIIIAGIFQPPIATVLAVTASVGIAIGFAAQDIIKNIFGGIMILFDRPFQVGDKVEIGDYYGEVVEIGLRSTRLVTPDDSLVSVPNAEVMNTSVSNSNAGEPNCQVVAEIYLPIDVDTARVRQIGIESAQVSRYIYLNKPIVVLFFNEVKERRSYLKMRLKAYVSDIRNEFAFKSDMTEVVMRELIKQKLIDPKELH
jgi:MscS family membrane protein